MDKVIGNNKVTVSGTIDEEFEFSHEIYGEGFYTTTISCVRLSGTIDHVPVMVSERLVAVKENWVGQYVEIEGQVRTYNKQVEGKSRLFLNIFAIHFEVLEQIKEINEVVLEGYLCKSPIYRHTPSGRQISDLLLAVNRSYGKSDYIPCICWGRNAKYAYRELDIGSHIRLKGRMQSRIYFKRLEEDMIKKTVYEVSVNNVEEVME